ncbi:hypothetical protein V5N11_016181 [Cardamine amara subsp. amara]|uniref:Transmembrane protein n=1 Tax=Cardamine amara subsp. amara TaxID=228776 RepID=A0ABD1BMJ9_CARAN
MDSPLLRNEEDIVGITIDDCNAFICPLVSRPIAFALNSIEFLMTLVQIVAAILVVKGTKGEHPEATWILVYTCGCIANLPNLCWRFWQILSAFSHLRINRVMFRLKNTLEYFFFGWFLVFLFVFVRSSSSSLDHTSQLFRLCVVFLAYNSIRYVIPYVIYTTIYCCLYVRFKYAYYREGWEALYSS